VSGWPMLEPWRMWVCESAISGMGRHSGGEGRTGQRGQSLRRAGSGERKCPRYGPARELDLEGVVAGWLRVGERGLGGTPEQLRLGPRAGQDPLRLAGAPWLQGDAAEHDA